MKKRGQPPTYYPIFLSITGKKCRYKKVRQISRLMAERGILE